MPRNQYGKRPKAAMPADHAEGSPPKSRRTSPRSRKHPGVTSRISGDSTSKAVSAMLSGANVANGPGEDTIGDILPNAETSIRAQASDASGRVQVECSSMKENPPDSEVPSASEKKFRLMDLPAELRLNIYRCCLTRPYNILLHKEPAPPVAKSSPPLPSVDNDGDEVESDDDVNGIMAVGTARITGPRTVGSNDSDAIRAAVRARMRTSTGGTAGRRVTRSSAQANRASQDAIDSNSYTPLPPPRIPKPQDQDPLVPAILCVSKQVYKEARSVLFADNKFDLELQSALPSLARLHQRSRGQIKHIELTIVNHGDILEKFAEVIRLGLRYCWGLQRFVIHMPFSLPGDGSGSHGTTTVYANAFDILRWLPRQAEVVLEGNVCEEIRTVAGKCANLAKTLDEVQYARRQLISNETERLAIMSQ
ncbi:hypothetical protein MBLNU230_g4619t1 [Neophaeotheca triangularis]